MTHQIRRVQPEGDEASRRPTISREARDQLRRAFVGVSDWSQAAFATVLELASDDHPVVIEGEAGTGKEFLARRIHQASARRCGPFVSTPKRKPPTRPLRVLMQDLTDHTVVQARSEWVSRASGGVLCVHESSLPDEIPSEDLLEVGERVLGAFDARLVVTRTVAKPRSGLPAGVGHLAVAPLRERRPDIEPLTKHFVDAICQQARREPHEISADALAVLRRYYWPGNLVELRRVVEHMVRSARPVCLDSSLVPSHVATHATLPADSFPKAANELSGRVRDFEWALISEALERCQGNMSAAARLLGLSVSTLHSKLKPRDVERGGNR